MKLAITTFLATAATASAAISLTNGNFATNNTTGWNTTGTVSAATGAAVLSAGATLSQDFSTGVTGTAENYDFQLDFSFSVSANNINQRIRIRDNSNAGDIITLRLNATGTGIERFSGTWGSALTGITITPNTTYWFRVVGSDLDLAGRSYTLGFSTDGVSYVSTGPLTGFHSALVGSDFETVTFESGAGTILTLDNVSVVPEPSAALLGGLGLLALLRRRRV